ncbi:glycerophosphodiester phosphodiesterase family protein [Salinibacterium sp. SYSU T00001]|uniref:glycerophosphodiester phosphodiesterase family protein n=1 Tax=Homoserinimonas sedimenticola TaxID=2986805 RepID=UPI0022367F59|nr:glycerophosphodiester phosphodiesterase family protein [Salinibacterium sedimenticola]MCW4385661.1 glycerophosphodiester phosphodiesterase family protein [Salinibacterium sedimenticola]
MPTRSAQQSRALAQTFGGLLGVPLRCWLLLWALYVLLARAVGPAAGALLDAALAQARIPALTPEALPALLAVPESWPAAAAALLLACGGALLWTATILTVAAEPSRDPRRIARGALATIRTWRWRRSLLFILPITFLSPILRVPVFAPVTRDIALPPFIGREFLKTPHTGALWVLGLTAVALAVFASLVILARGRDPLGGPRRWLRDHWRMTLVVAAIALFARVVPPDAGILTDALMVIAAVAAGLALVGTLRAAPPSPQRHRTSPAVAAASFTAVVALSTGASVVTPYVAADGHEPEQEDALVIAHRGFVSGGPENTILGLEAAAPHEPDFVEVDVMQTGDGGIVASHDSNLAVLAGVPRNVYEMTTDEVTSTIIEMHGQRDAIPTMTDYVLRAKQLGLPLLIELKLTGHEVGDFPTQVIEELEEIDGLEGNMFHSLDPATVRELEREHPELDTGLTIAMLQGELPDIDCDFLVIEQSSITPEMVQAAHARDMPLYAWTVNDENAMRSLLDLGVDGIVTDNLEASALSPAG